MQSQLNTHIPRHPVQALAPGLAPEEVVQHKLTRLLELRAVIDAMRFEREAQDPLLAWVRGRDRL